MVYPCIQAMRILLIHAQCRQAQGDKWFFQASQAGSIPAARSIFIEEKALFLQGFFVVLDFGSNQVYTMIHCDSLS